MRMNVMSKREFRVEVETRPGHWGESGLGVFPRAKDAYQPARDLWVASKRLLRTFSYGAEYTCLRVRVIPVGSSRVTHLFPSLRTEYTRPR